MPYRDSEEDKIPVDKWSETIFQYDLSALQSADLLLGFWDGPAFDEGIGFEIGCGLAWGKKAVVLNTDFLQYHVGEKDILDVLDPLGSDADRQAIDGADHMVFYASGPELPPGVAVSAGWAYGRDVPFDLVLDRSACMVGMTGGLMLVNLMLQEAASWTGSPEEHGIRLQELLGSDC